jgi:ABC-type Fe3+/spermidine/putrescine transport system ATPase subunit
MATSVITGTSTGTSVSLREVTRAFGAVRALDGMSLDIAPGELVALLGPSGCGKTTALRIVAGFEYATSGQVLVDGRDVSGVPAARRDMGMVFQSYSLFPNMNALDNVAFGLRMRGMAAGARKKRAAELLEMVGHRQGLLLVVRDEQGGDAEPLLQGPDLLPELDADLGIKGGQWLVKQEHAGLDR